MSGDEVFVSLVSAVIALGIWIATFVRIVRFGRNGRYGLPQPAASALLFALPACLVLVFAILRTLASQDVREDGRYLAMYGFLGAAWFGIAPGLFLPGISLRDDFLERRNASAAYAILGFMIASTLCYSGGNIGDGPGWWVVVFCAAPANIALALLWSIANQFAPIADVITIDRDPAAGIRVGGFFIGCGLILGRAVAGNWTSATGTLRDFATRSWPVLVLTVILVLAERWAKPRFKKDEQGIVARGLFPALFYIVTGLFAALAQGKFT